jgi:hypothetical protein
LALTLVFSSPFVLVLLLLRLSCVVQCYIKTYVEWLTDSTFEDAKCGICRDTVTAENALRLSCLDLFHADCLDAHCSALPAHTAKAGYMCPTCTKPIFPPETAVQMGGYDGRKDGGGTRKPTLLIETLNNHLSRAEWSKPLMQGRALEPPTLYQLDSPPGDANLNASVDSHAGGSAPVLADISASGRDNNDVSIDMGDDADEDKYRRRSTAAQVLTTLGLVSPSGRAGRGRGFRLNTRRVLILAALLSSLLIVVFLGSSLSPEPPEGETSG